MSDNKVYIVKPASPAYKQLNFDDFFNNMIESPDKQINTLLRKNETNTYTYYRELKEEELNDSARVYYANLISLLKSFNEKHKELLNSDLHSHYHTFNIPKKTGGFRTINAPDDDLKNALNELKAIFENDFKILYHTSAFAYVKGRSTKNAVEKHQQNDSKWFLKLDLHDFFGSTTMEFVLSQLSTIYPFSEIIKMNGEEELKKALSLGFLDGGLPQGTPLSPILTNIIMIPIDHKLFNLLRNEKEIGTKYVYTRYADDMCISCRYSFKFTDIQDKVKEVLALFNAPYEINTKKTHYGSSSGKNWILGVMLNKDNNITVGAKKKRQFKAMLTNYALDSKNGNKWTKEDVMILQGIYAYYYKIEGQTIDEIVNKISKKFKVDIKSCIKQDLKK